MIGIVERNACSDHTAYYDMVEWAYHIEIDRACPVVVVNDCDDVEPFHIRLQRFDGYYERSLQVAIFRFSNPVSLFLGHANGKKRHFAASYHWHILWLHFARTGYTTLSHAKKTHYRLMPYKYSVQADTIIVQGTSKNLPLHIGDHREK